MRVESSKTMQGCCLGRGYAKFIAMSNLIEIEAAIERLPDPQVDQLAQWLEAHRHRRMAPPPIEGWLQRVRGAAVTGVKTSDVMALTRGEE